MRTHVPRTATSVTPRQQTSLSGPIRARHCPHNDAPRCVKRRPSVTALLRHATRPQRRVTTRQRSPAALLSGTSADVDESASVASLQSQDEAYLLSPLHAASGVDSMSLQSVDDVALDAREWQKGLLGRMGRFGGNQSTCAGVTRDTLSASMLERISRTHV